MRDTVGRHQPVTAEIGIVGALADVAAEEEPSPGATQAVVAPFPDEPTLQTVDVLERRHVVGQAAGVAHRVAELAQDERPSAVEAVGRPLPQAFDRRVHRADQIAHRGLGVEVVHERALVVEGTGRIGTSDPRRRGIVRRAVPGLVAERPGDHARVVAIAQHHASAAFQDRPVVADVVAQRRLTGVGLDVGLVDHVQAVLVAQVVEQRIVRVVGAPDGVDMVLLHQLQIATHRGLVDGPAPVGIELVAIDPDDDHWFAVDQQLAVPHLDRPEPDALAAHVDHVAERRAERDDGPIERRALVVPRLDTGHVDPRRDDRPLPEHAGEQLGEHACGIPTAVFEDRHRGMVDTGEAPGTVGLDAHVDCPSLGGVVAVEVDLDAHVEGARRPIGGQARHQRHVAQRDRGDRDEPHRPVETRHPPLVLVLQPGRCRPLVDDQHHLVRPRDKPLGHVERRRQPTVGPHADGRTVDPRGEEAVGAADLEQHAPAPPIAGHAERAPVDAGRVVRRHRWRVVVERHHDVRVGRRAEPVLGPALQHPGARYLDLVPPAGGLADDVGTGEAPHGSVGPLGRVDEPEVPGAVERPDERGRFTGARCRRIVEGIERRTHWQAPPTRHLRCRPGVDASSGHRFVTGRRGTGAASTPTPARSPDVQEQVFDTPDERARHAVGRGARRDLE